MSDPSKLKFLVGATDTGETIYGDFQKTGHFISTGHVGSGHASYDEAAFVTNLLQTYSPDELQFVMIDPKMVQLTPYEGIPYLWRPLALNPDDAFNAVKDLLDEMEHRFDMLMDAGVNTIVEYNAKVEEKMPFIILLATEIADLMMVNGEFFGRAFTKFSQMARAVGIHMYLATQRPSADVLIDVVLGGTFGRLIFAVASDIDSERLLGDTSAAKITEQGRLIFADYTSNIIESVKANYVTDEEVMKVVESIKESN